MCTSTFLVGHPNYSHSVVIPSKAHEHDINGYCSLDSSDSSSWLRVTGPSYSKIQGSNKRGVKIIKFRLEKIKYRVLIKIIIYYITTRVHNREGEQGVIYPVDRIRVHKQARSFACTRTLNRESSYRHYFANEEDVGFCSLLY